MAVDHRLQRGRTQGDKVAPALSQPQAHDSQSNSPPHSAAQGWVQSEKKDVRYVISNTLFLIVVREYS